MAHQEEKFEAPDEELESSSSIFEIPFWLKILVTIAASLSILFCIYASYKYFAYPDIYDSPADLDLPTIFLFSLSILFAIWIPWQRLGMRITRIGGIEFKEIVAEQASEHAEEISYLQDRIEYLESRIRSLDETAEFTEQFEEPKLRDLLIEFLTKYHQWAFSPSRIRAWGSQKRGFSELSNYEHQFIRSTLQKMVSEKVIETRISKNGNTLYRISTS